MVRFIQDRGVILIGDTKYFMKHHKKKYKGENCGSLGNRDIGPTLLIQRWDCFVPIQFCTAMNDVEKHRAAIISEVQTSPGPLLYHIHQASFIVLELLFIQICNYVWVLIPSRVCLILCFIWERDVIFPENTKCLMYLHHKKYEEAKSSDLDGHVIGLCLLI